MNTAQGGALSYIIYAVVYVIGLRYLAPHAAAQGKRPSIPAIALWLVVAVPSLAGLIIPAVFTALSRQPDAIEHGQIWRLLTSVSVQDDGLVGTIYNLITLALTATAAFRVMRWWTAVGTFVIGAVGFNVVATYVWHAAGGGNSAATFFLLTATIAVTGVHRRTRTAGTAVIVTAAAGTVLLILNDAHGTAVLGGMALGGIIGFIGRTRASTPGTSLETGS